MTDSEIYEKATQRVHKTTGKTILNAAEIIAFLEKEIDRYREKIRNMETRIEELTTPAQTFTEERTSDGGTMTIRRAMCYQDIVQILLENGYFVTCHIDENEHDEDTITIEFWRA